MHPAIEPTARIRAAANIRPSTAESSEIAVSKMPANAIDPIMAKICQQKDEIIEIK